jgi:membrane protease YdiL (CAAX protease family)
VKPSVFPCLGRVRGLANRHVGSALRTSARELARLRAASGGRVPLHIAVVVTAAFVVYGNVVVWAGRHFGERRPAIRESITLFAVPAVGVLGALVLVALGWTWADLGLRWPCRRRARCALAVWAAVVGAYGARYLITGTGLQRLSVVRVLVGTAFGEELVHRSVLLAVWLASPVRLRSVVVANAMAFGLWHVVGANTRNGFKFSEVVIPMGLGLGLLWARLWYRSVLAPAIVHAVNIFGVANVGADSCRNELATRGCRAS